MWLPCSFTAHAAPTGSPPAMDALHFFGVFDGHGGAEAALHCARTLHERIAEVRACRLHSLRTCVRLHYT